MPALAADSRLLFSTRDRPHPEHWLHNLPADSFAAVAQELKGFRERITELSAKYCKLSVEQHPEYMRPWFHAEALSFVESAVVMGIQPDAVEDFAGGQIREYVRWHNAKEGVPTRYAEDAFDHHVLVAVEMVKRAAIVGEG